MQAIETVVKTAPAMRVARFTHAVPGYGTDHVDQVYEKYLPDFWAALVRLGLELGPGVAEFEEPKGTDDVLVHLGYEVGAQRVPHINGVHVVELEEVEVVSTLVRGPMREATGVYEALVRWVETSGYRLDGWPRQLHHQWEFPDPDAQLTEIQLPIAR